MESEIWKVRERRKRNTERKSERKRDMESERERQIELKQKIVTNRIE